MIDAIPPTKNGAIFKRSRTMVTMGTSDNPCADMIQRRMTKSEMIDVLELRVNVRSLCLRLRLSLLWTTQGGWFQM
jgi:hypothetical protein